MLQKYDYFSENGNILRNIFKNTALFCNYYHVQEPTVAYRHDYATETHYESEEYPFMISCNNDELANHVLAREEEYARTGNAVDFLEMMADFKNEFEW